MNYNESSLQVLLSGEMFSSCVSNENDAGCSSMPDLLTPVVKEQHRRPTDYNGGDESSSSSFYSSLLYKSSNSSCNPDQKTCEGSPEIENQAGQCPKDVCKVFQNLSDILQMFLKSFSHVNVHIYIFDLLHICVNLQEHTKCHPGKRRRNPPWLEGVQLTPELIYEYQMQPKTLNEVLKADMDAMKSFNQPLLVNDQLDQLYLDLDVENFSKELVLEDGVASSGSESSSGSWTESQVTLWGFI